MKFILGTKQYMTQTFDDTGRVIPATVIAAAPGTVLQTKTTERDGYSSVQLGFIPQKESRIGKAGKGLFTKAGSPTYRVVREYKGEGNLPSVGEEITVGIFEPGMEVTVSGVSKGKGFQGVVKRHGFAGGPRTHGQKHSEREPGAIGGGGGRAGGRVAKGIRMAGRMGGERVTVPGLRVLLVDSANNLLVVSGAVPGRRGTIVEVRGK